jgi:hypothetical protein
MHSTIMTGMLIMAGRIPGTIHTASILTGIATGMVIGPGTATTIPIAGIR